MTLLHQDVQTGSHRTGRDYDVVTSATGSGRMAPAVDRHGIISREDKSVGPSIPICKAGSAGGRRCGTSCSRSSDAGLSTGGLAGKCLPEPGEIAGVDIGDSAECQAARTPGFHGVAVT